MSSRTEGIVETLGPVVLSAKQVARRLGVSLRHDKQMDNATCEKREQGQENNDKKVSLPLLPTEWKTHTGDLEIDRVANLLHIALATILDARRNKYSQCQITQLQKLFEEECIEAKGFFSGTSRKTIELPPSERVDFVKSGTAWVDTVSEWFRQNVSGPINLDDWKGLHDQLISLIEVHNVMWSISIETIKRNAKLALQQVLQKPTETEQISTPPKRGRIWNRLMGPVKEYYGLTVERVTKAFLDKYG